MCSVISMLLCRVMNTLHAHHSTFLRMKKGIPSPKGRYAHLAHPAGFEPTACRLGGGRSILLSYGCMLRYIGCWVHCEPTACLSILRVSILPTRAATSAPAGDGQPAGLAAWHGRQASLYYTCRSPVKQGRQVGCNPPGAHGCMCAPSVKRTHSRCVARPLMPCAAPHAARPLQPRASGAGGL